MLQIGLQDRFFIKITTCERCVLIEHQFGNSRQKISAQHLPLKFVNQYIKYQLIKYFNNGVQVVYLCFPCG
jgi:hypothetical protein